MGCAVICVCAACFVFTWMAHVGLQLSFSCSDGMALLAYRDVYACVWMCGWGRH